MYRPRKTSPSAALVSLSFAAIASIALVAGCKRREAAEANATKAADEAPIAVKTVVAVEQPMPRWLRLTASLAADEAADVAADVTGKVLEVKVDRGSIVKKGDLLVRTDARTAALASAEATASLDVARAQVAQAKIDCDRTEALYKSGAISGAEYDRAHSLCLVTQSSEKAAEARVATASKPLVDSNIRAPFAGLVSERYVNTGEYVRPETKCIRLMAIDPIRLELSVPEASVALIKQQQAVDFRVAAFDETFHATVRYVGPSLRAQSRDLVVEAVATNADQKLRPGMFATAQIDLGEAPAIVVPKDALKSDGTNMHLFVVKDGRLEERIVEIGETKGDLVAVPTGVAKGDKVVSPVTAEARDGAKVK